MYKKLQKFSPYIITTLLIFVFSVHQAHAQVAQTLINLTLGALDSIIAAISQSILYIMHWFVVATAALFSVSINLNLHIKAFVDATPGVYNVWTTIRDVCSLFVIFMLLYSAIRMILSEEANVGKLLKNIVIGGILINFSFFITSLLIDASNMVSLAIYKGIVSSDQSIGSNAATGSSCITNSTGNSDSATKCLVDGILNPKSTGSEASLGDFFLAKLSPQKIYNLKLVDTGESTNNSVSDNTPAPLRTLIQGVVGSVIMFTVSMSFLFASIAFASRLVILVVMLAFSSIWFASRIFPALKEQSERFEKILKGQLIFMPVYLLLLYGALVVLNQSTVFQSPTGGTGGSDLSWLSGYIVLAVNDFFIIFLLNLPLVTAFAFASETTSWLKADRFNATNVWKGVGTTSGSFAGRHTVGRAAYIANNSGVMKSLNASSPFIGNIVSKRLDKVSNAGFGQKKGGFKDRIEQQQKDYKARYADVGKASASERLMYSDVKDKETGKSELDNFLEQRQKAYFDALSKPTILSNLANKAKEKTAEGIGYVVHATDVIQDKIGPNKVVDAIGQAAFKTAMGTMTAGSNVTASFSASESAAMQEIKKMRDAEQKKAEAKLAKDDLKKLKESADHQEDEYTRLIDNLTKNQNNITNEIQDLNKHLSDLYTTKEENTKKLRERISLNNQTILYDKFNLPIKNPSVIKDESEISEMETNYLTEKTDAENQLKALQDNLNKVKDRKTKMIENNEKRNHVYEERRNELQEKIKAGESIESKEQNEQLINVIKSSSGSGGSAPTPPKPTP